MGTDRPIIVFGPAYLDLVLEIGGPIADPSIRLDQSLPAHTFQPAANGEIRLLGPSGDEIVFQLPEEDADIAGCYLLSEPILQKLRGSSSSPVRACHEVTRVARQMGGMGAGYACACGGLLRHPVGDDMAGREIAASLARYGITAEPRVISGCATDSSLVIVNNHEEKLAVGVRRAMVRWRPEARDFELARSAFAIIFCGAPNSFAAELMSQAPDIPIMYAPAMRNVCDAETSLASLSAKIDYLTLNALEWAHLSGKEELRKSVKVISVTGGARGSMLYLNGQEIAIPAELCANPLDTNRAGETFGATFFKTLLAEAPDFHRVGVDRDIAMRAARKASRQAARQLMLRDFAFPAEKGEVS